MNHVRRLRAREDGLTLVELLVAMTILGFIMAAISSALFMAFKMPTDARDRDTFTSSASFFVNQYSDDVANATSYTSNASGGGLFDVTGCKTKSFAGFNFGWAGLGSFTQHYPPATDVVVEYAVKTTELSPADPTYLNVVVQRRVNGGAYVDQIVGYCKKSDANAGLFRFTAADPRYSLNVQMLTAKAGEYRILSADASRRKYP